jgi:hypothetical protein
MPVWSHLRPRPRWIALLAVLVLGLSGAPGAHEIPSEVTIQMFVKPEGQRLRVLVRAPLEAMTDIDWPLVGAAGVLDIARADRFLNDAATLWLGDNLKVLEGDQTLPYPRVAAVRASARADGAFQNYDLALAQTLGPRLPEDTRLVKNEGMLDVLFEFPIMSDQSRFSVYPHFVRLGSQTRTIITFLRPDGTLHTFELHGDPGLVLMEPTTVQAAWRFAKDGFFHILDGSEHVLFLLCLLIPFRRISALVPIVTSFAVAHTLTLVASIYDMTPGAFWFPVLVEMLIAVSILYMAFENVAGPRLERRWLMTIAFGMVHGFAFAFALKSTLQFAGRHVFTSLVAFNVGLEAGLLLLVALLVPILQLLFQHVVSERLGTIVLSLLLAHTAWHWTWDRYNQLVQYQFVWPDVDAAFLAIVLRWLMVLVILAGAGWIIHGFVDRGAAAEAGKVSET